MFKSKVFDILETFSLDEMKSFKDFVNSPYHNKNKNVVRLFITLKGYYPNFESHQLTKEKTFKTLFPGKKYNDLVMRIMMSNLLSLLEKFLVLQSTGLDRQGYSRYLIAELIKRKLYSSAKKEFSHAGISSISSPNDFIHKMLLASKKTEFSILTDNQKGNEEYLQEFGNNLLAYFLIKLPETYHDLNIHKDLYNINVKHDFIGYFIENFNFDSYIKYLSDNNFENIELVKLYNNMYRANKNIDDDKSFYDFKKSIEKQIDYLNHEEQYNLYIRLEGLAIEKIERGRSDFYKELFDIYNKMIKKNILIVPGSVIIPVELFRNIVFTAMVLQKYRWAEKFINDYIIFITPNLKDNVYNHSLAHLYFTTKNFDKALEYLNKVKYKLFVYKADVKILLLQIYLETMTLNSAYSALDSFKKFVTNNKNVSNLFKRRYSGFIKYYGKLLKAIEKNDSKFFSELEYDVKREELILKKQWLLEKLKDANKLLHFTR